MSNLNKILVIGALIMSTQASAQTSDCKVELEAIVHFTHKLEKQTKLAQWLQKIIASDYCSSQTIIVIAATINSNDSMDEKIAHLLAIKNQQEATAKEELLSNIQAGAAGLCMVIAVPTVLISSIMIGEDLSKKLLARLNRPATGAKKTEFFSYPGLLR